MRDDHINLIFLKIAGIVIMGILCYQVAGSNGVTIMTATLFTSQIIGIKPDW